MTEMTVGVGSKNDEKIEAVTGAFEVHFPKIFGTVLGFESSSGVSAQPMSRHEAMLGAKNRADDVIAQAQNEKIRLDYAIGIEGGIDLVVSGNGYEFFNAAFIRRVGDAAIGFATSRSFPLPPALFERLREGEEMGAAVFEAFGDSIEPHGPGYGLLGVITNGRLTKEIAMQEAVEGALAPFYSPYVYDATRFIKRSVRYTE